MSSRGVRGDRCGLSLLTTSHYNRVAQVDTSQETDNTRDNAFDPLTDNRDVIEWDKALCPKEYNHSA